MKIPSIAFSSLVLFAAASPAALAPGTVDKMKKEATEVLRLEIVGVEKKEAKGIQREVIYEAVVVAAERSKSELKPGAKIKFESYYFEKPKLKPLGKNATEEELRKQLELLEPIVGPKPPALLDKGWKGKVYLVPAKTDGQFRIAVYGHSFE